MPARPNSDIETKVTAIIRFHVDVGRSDMHFLSLVLDAGKIPDYVADTLRPIVWKLLTAKQDEAVSLNSAEESGLADLHEEVLFSIQQRAATLEMLETTINQQSWRESENNLAAEFGLKVLPACPRTLEIAVREIDTADFGCDEILHAFNHEHDTLIEFCSLWSADCNRRSREEEWDPDEGNQQAGNPKGTVLGMTQGFLVGYTLLYLYAALKPEVLPKFLKRKGTPSATNRTKKILGIYRKVAAK